MRKVILMLVTLIALVGAFVGYFLMQSKYGLSIQGDKGADSFPVSGEGGGILKPGAGAWSKQYDKDGNLYYQFKCDFYDPQPDGTVKVKHPVIEFFLSGGQVLQIEGKDGQVRLAQGTDKGMLTNAPADPPRYGMLRDVKVKLFNSVDRQNANDAEMTMSMANAQFDDDTYRLFTEDYTDDSGKFVRHDQVPVTVDAPDYSFRGSGLTLYWNDLDKQLKSLLIDHGKDLTLSADSGFTMEPAGSAAPAPAPPANAGAGSAPPGPSVAAPANNAAAGPPGPMPSRQRYTATFYANVRIVQGDDLVTADQMNVDFASKAQGSAGGQTSPTPTTTPAANAPPSTQPAAAGAPTSQPTQQPTHQPIQITWSGPMKMVPTDLATAPPLGDGKAIVHLVGAPVTMHQVSADDKQTADIQCDDLRYYTEDSSAQLSGGVKLTQKKLDGPASIVTGENLFYSRVQHLARFDGPGESRFPDPNDAKSVLVSRWEKSCTLNLYDIRENNSQIEDAILERNVSVDDAPRFHMTARDDLRLHFDRMTGGETKQSEGPPLRRIMANGNADCLLQDADKQVRHVHGEHLQLFRDPGPDGKLYAKTIVCEGSVLAQEEEQSLRAEKLRIGLLPAKPRKVSRKDEELGDSVALDELLASDNVRVTGKDGQFASGDSLEVHMVDEHPHVTLLGAGNRPAIVKNKTSTITGWNIRMSPHDQTAAIEGPGTFAGIQEGKNPGEKPRPVKLVWSHSARLDGNANRAVVDGEVSGGSDDPDGSHQTVNCGRVVVTLVDVAPTSRPAAKAAKNETFADGDDFMKDKQIRTLSLRPAAAEANATTQPTVEVESYLLDADGFPLRQNDLITHKSIDYDDSSKQMVVDGPGDIIAAEKASAATQPASDTASVMGGQGTTAIDWKERFVYNNEQNWALITGDVQIAHDGEGPKSQSLKLMHANTVRADFEGSSHGSGDAGGTGATPKLKHLSATGDMRVYTADQTITCGELEFDPVSQILTCLPGDLQNVSFVDNKTLAGATCSELVYDMKTNELTKVTNLTGQGK